MIKFIATLLPWLAIVALFSLTPELPRVPGVSKDLAAVSGHFIVYAILAALVYRFHMRIRSGGERRPLDSAFIAAGISATAGLAFEWSQHLLTTSRTFQVEDVIANTVGAAAMSTGLMLLEISGSKLRLLLPAIFAAGVVLTAFAATSYVIWDPTLPYAGDHWHARYRVVICGEEQPVFRVSEGGIHTHGGEIIHVHPLSSTDEGKKANLGAFFRSVDGDLTNTAMTMPDGETYTNGDACPDGSTGFVSVSQFSTETLSRVDTNTNPANYVPRSREWIIIEFGPVPDNGT